MPAAHERERTPLERRQSVRGPVADGLSDEIGDEVKIAGRDFQLALDPANATVDDGGLLGEKPCSFCTYLCAVLEHESEYEYGRQRQYDRQEQPHGNARESRAAIRRSVALPATTSLAVARPCERRASISTRPRDLVQVAARPANRVAR